MTLVGISYHDERYKTVTAIVKEIQQIVVTFQVAVNYIQYFQNIFYRCRSNTINLLLTIKHSVHTFRS